MYLILAIDDDVNVLKLLNAQLSTVGFKLISAHTPDEGLSLARTGNPDLILLDIMMPKRDGMETLKILRNDESTKEIPVIMLTSKSGKEDVANAMKGGAVDYLLKPYDIDTLKRKIESSIRYYRMKKVEGISEKSEHINVTREIGRTVIRFLTPLGSPRILEDMKVIFSTGFLNLTVKDNLVLDFRLLNEIEQSSIPILKAIFSLFANRNVYIIAGRHYGFIVSEIETDENIHLFISPGDMELELEKHRSH